MKQTIQTRRNAKTKTGFRKLHASTTARKRKLRAATAMANPHVDLESDVPNVGIGRALIVILVLHVVAIAAVYAHSTFFGEDGGTSVADSGASKTVAAAVAVTADPVANMQAPAAEGEFGRYIVVTGDSYSRIAHRSHVDETALRALNNNRSLRAGVVLDLPAKLSSRPVAVTETPAQRASRAVAVTEDASSVTSAPRAVVIEEASAPRAVVVQSATGTQPVATALKDGGARYTVKSGDTVWRIANNHKVTSKQLLEINGIKDASKLQIGRELIIPAR